MTASLVRRRLALGPFVPTLRRLTRAPSMSRNKRVSQQLRLRGARGLTKIRQAIALTDLEFLDDLQPGMALLGQLDRGVGEIAAALVLGDEFRRLVRCSRKAGQPDRPDLRPRFRPRSRRTFALCS